MTPNIGERKTYCLEGSSSIELSTNIYRIQTAQTYTEEYLLHSR